jgi:hypothetical protein
MRTGVVIGVLCLAGGAAALILALLGRSDLLQDDGPATRAAVLARIPLGTEIARAEAIMEAEGFKCAALRDPEPSGRRPADAGRGQERTLWRDSGERLTLLPLVTKRWQVSFVDADGHVSEVSVGVGLTGL